MSLTQTVTLNFTGGIISPGFLYHILDAAEKYQVKRVRFGLRQQLVMDIPSKHAASFKRACYKIEADFFDVKEATPNIVSSYVAAGIFTADSWLREGVYKDIFGLFDYKPRLKINVCDSGQAFVPFFTGNINWISSSSQHFWHLYIRFPKTQKIYQWPELVYTNDIATLSEIIEQAIFVDRDSYFGNEFADGTTLFNHASSVTTYISKKAEQQLSLPDFSLPYYEGFNRHGNQYWLGIYRRDEMFPVAFLKEICSICIETKIGQFYTTPWKSIIIKGIEHAHRKLWDYALGKSRINVRHAANELNWQVEDNTEEGLSLKRHVIRFFDKEDVRTYGLCFAVQTKLSSGMFGSIVIRKCQVKNPHRLKALERFDILYKSDFNPNSSRLVLFRDNVEKNHIGTYLISLCKLFYDSEKHKLADGVKQLKESRQVTPHQPAGKKMHQCSHCFSIYDATAGEPENNIPPGTAFEDLPSTYCCPLCEAPKEDFTEVEEQHLQLKTA